MTSLGASNPTDPNLRSLSTFMDVLYGLGFFWMFEFMPSFQNQQWIHLPHGVFSLLASQPQNLIRVGFGLIVIIYYWYRKNALMTVVERYSGSLGLLAVTSLVFLYLFLYAFAADPMYVGGPPTLLLQSLSILLASLFGYFALQHAIRASLIRPEMKSAAEQLARVDLSNPLTAAIAAALSWSGLTIWTLSWFILMPLLAALLARTIRTSPGRSS